MNDLSYILNHLGENRESYFQAVSPPIIQTSNFVLKDIASLRSAVMDEWHHHLYSRGNNPTVAILRKKIAALEHTEDALVCSSGSGAITATVVSQVQQGDHIICVQNPYSWTKHLLTEFLPRYGVSASFVDGRSIDHVAAAIQPNTKVLFLESPNTMTFDVQDLEACVALAKKHGLVTCIDNSYCSPYFQQPADFGIDFVLHSGTKYLNGHSDVVAGVVCGSFEKIREVFERTFMVWGPLLSPGDAALMIRGLRTLSLRMDRSDQSARLIASRLSDHPRVLKVLYPGLPDFDQADLVAKQMTGCGGLFSILLDTSLQDQIFRFVESLNRFLIAVSWGGHESLVMPIAAFYNMENRKNPEFPINLVRFYIGLEDPEVLWADLKSALDHL